MKHVWYGCLIACAALTACRKEAPAPAQAPQTATQTVAPAAPPPAAATKVTISLQPAAEPSAETRAQGEKLAQALGERAKLDVEVVYPKDYADAIGMLRKKKAQVVLLSGWAYLKAHHVADADLLLAQELDGKTSFTSEWFVAADSKLQKTADLRGKRLAFSSPTSGPGFLLPYSALIRDGVVKPGEDLQKAFKELYFVGEEAGALAALLEGKVDAAAGPGFAPQLYLPEPERGKVRSIGSIEGAPTHVLAVRADLDAATRASLEAGLLALNEDKGLLQGALGATGLVKRSHGDHVTALQNAQELVGTEYTIPEEPEPAPAAPAP